MDSLRRAALVLRLANLDFLEVVHCSNLPACAASQSSSAGRSTYHHLLPLDAGAALGCAIGRSSVVRLATSCWLLLASWPPQHCTNATLLRSTLDCPLPVCQSSTCSDIDFVPQWSGHGVESHLTVLQTPNGSPCTVPAISNIVPHSPNHSTSQLRPRTPPPATNCNSVAGRWSQFPVGRMLNIQLRVPWPDRILVSNPKLGSAAFVWASAAGAISRNPPASA